MRPSTTRAILASALAIVATATIHAQKTLAPKAQAHVAAARAAATNPDAKDFFDSLCNGGTLTPQPRRAAPRPAQADADGSAPRDRAVPDRASWYVEPVQVFDNLYYIGQRQVSAWAITTSAGIIVMDALYDYSVEDEVLGGLKKLGLDPMQVKYLLISHAHFDHYGGAKILQERIPGLRVVASEIDWKGLEREGANGRAVPRRDIAIKDGDTLTLGDTTLTLRVTPGHTPGTISPLVPVFDRGTRYLAAEWGGTAFNSPPTLEYFSTYAGSAATFREIVTKAGATVLIGPHPHRDGSNRKIPLLKQRKPGEPHPYVVGTDHIRDVLTVISECAAGRGAQLEAESK